MKENRTAQELLEFIRECPDSFHTVRTVSRSLREAGFTALSEQDSWAIQPGGKYFATRGQSSLIAFRIPDSSVQNLRVVASHGDSPCFQIKENAQQQSGPYVQLNTEPYGGLNLSSWLDRPLSAAGRILVRDGDKLRSILVDCKRDIALIPSVAVHLRDPEEKKELNPQVDMLPLFSLNPEETILSLAALNAGIAASDIVSSDLYLYNRQQGVVWGAEDEFLSAPRLDDLQCVFAALQGFLQTANTGDSLCVYAVFDHEEIGSNTKQGADSSFLADVLNRIRIATGQSEEEYHRLLASGWMLSADNAHAVHPGHTEKADPTNRPQLGGGVVVKFNANRRYTTDSVSFALIKTICVKENIPYQTYTNRSDQRGGATLGSMLSALVPLHTADVGLPQLAMHSAYETSGSGDTAAFIQLTAAFYRSKIMLKEAVL